MNFSKDPEEAFFTLIRSGILSKLGLQYPYIAAKSSFEEPSSESQSRSQKGEPREWIAFSFAGYNFWDLHLGIVLDKESNRIVMGVHFSTHLWPIIKEKVGQIRWEEYSTLKPTYVFIEALNEHRFVEPEITLNLSRMGDILQEIVDKAVVYYEVVNKVVTLP